MGKKTIGIGDGLNKQVQARCFEIEKNNPKQDPTLEKTSRDKALIAVITTNKDAQHTPSDATRSDSRASKRVRWNQEKPSDTIINNRNEALRITDKTLIAVHTTSDGTQRTPSDARHSDSRTSKRVRWNQEKPSDTIISNRNEALRITDKTLIADTENASYDFAVKDTIMKLTLMFPEQVTTERMKKIKEVAIEGYKLADDVYTARDAEEWGDHYKVPDELVQSDEALFRASMRDIKVMAKRRQQQLLSGRLNASRVRMHTRPDNPEREKLMLLAEKGMPLLLREGFKSNGQGKLPPLRKTYMSVKSAVNRLLVKNFHELGLAFILTKETALTIPDIHFSPLHWTEKQGKRQGRPIGDCSDGGSENGNEPLNSLSTKERSDQLWGQIHHPSIDDVANMINDYYETAVRDNPTLEWSDLEMFQKDLKGAFTLLFFDADGVQHLAMEMTDEKVIIFTCGIFGWTGTPAAFQVINRAIKHELKHGLKGSALMYSDDIFVVTTKKNAVADMLTTDQVCCNLMGPDSMEQTKAGSGRRLTFIGYDIDLDKRLITISRRNILRALHGFLIVDKDVPMKVKTMQKLASWASRYGKICVYMKPFISVLYAEYTGRNDHASFQISARAWQVIRYFRVLLGLTAVNDVEFARPLKSFKRATSNLIIEFDASLTGIGLLYYQQSGNAEVLLGGGSVDISALHFASEASYQNTAEFIAAVLGIRGLRQLRLQPDSVCLRGDSMTALTWASTRRFRGELVGNAAAVFVLQNIYEKVTISEVIHIAAEDNWRADYLSRGGTLDDLYKKDTLLKKAQTVELNGDMIIQMCDPGRPTTTDEEFNSFWCDMRRILGINY